MLEVDKDLALQTLALARAKPGVAPVRSKSKAGVRSAIASPERNPHDARGGNAAGSERPQALGENRPRGRRAKI
jgi:hypothetical protein